VVLLGDEAGEAEFAARPSIFMNCQANIAEGLFLFTPEGNHWIDSRCATRGSQTRKSGHA